MKGGSQVCIQPGYLPSGFLKRGLLQTPPFCQMVFPSNLHFLWAFVACCRCCPYFPMDFVRCGFPLRIKKIGESSPDLLRCPWQDEDSSTNHPLSLVIYLIYSIWMVLETQRGIYIYMRYIESYKLQHASTSK